MPRSRAFLALLVLLAAAVAALAQPYWLTGPTSPFACTRFDGEYHPITKKVYFFSGRNSSGGTDSTIYSYDPSTGAYANTGARMAVPVSNYNVVAINIHSGADSIGLLVAGGRNAAGGSVNNLQVYVAFANAVIDLASDPWPGTIGGAVTQPAQGCVACGNKLYAFGGFQSVAAPYLSDSTYIMDVAQPTGSWWSRGPVLSQARGYITPAVVNGYVYAIGGATYDGAALYAQTTVERLNTGYLPGGWEIRASLPTPLGEAQAFGFDTGDKYGLGGYIILAGGGAWPGDTSVCYIYNTAGNAWTSFPWSLNFKRRDHAGVMITDTLHSGGNPGIWVFGGRSGTDANLLTQPEYIPMPFPPLYVSATPQPYSAFIAWQGMSGTVLGYKIYRGTSSGGPYDSIGFSAVNSFTDNSAPTGATYYYVVKARYQIDGKAAESMYSPEGSCYVGVSGNPPTGLPKAHSLAGCRPNPMNGRADIRFALPGESRVRLDIYGSTGQLVRRLADGRYPAGFHQARWDGRDDAGTRVAAGVYVLRLKAGSFAASSRIVVVR
jgi:hypothetical protein